MIKDKKLIKDLIDIGKKLAKSGLIIGEGGNISARNGRVIYIKKKNSCMEDARSTDYITVDLESGKSVVKNQKPSSEIPLHLACYRAKKEIKAVMHTHPVFATALGIAGIRPGFASYEMAVLLKSELARIPYIRSGTEKLGRAVGKAVLRHNAILLKNHGLVTVGGSLEEAFLRTLAVERASLIYLCSKMSGKIDFIKTPHLV